MPDERWQFPIAVRAVTVVIALANMAVIKVLFVDAFGFPLMVLVAVLAIVLAGRASSVTLSTSHRSVEVRTGFLREQIPLQRIRSAYVKRTGVTIIVAGGRSVSLASNWLVSWLRIQTPAEDIARAVNLALEEDREAHADEPAPAVTLATRNNRAMIALAGVGVVAIIAAFLVRFSWPNPVLTVLAVMFAVYIGLTGAFLVIFAVGILSSGRRAPRS